MLSVIREQPGAAPAERQGIYDRIAFVLHMPKIPVRLSLREWGYRRGAAHSVHGRPGELRIFPIGGCPEKKRSRWEPDDLTLVSPRCACEILLHEPRSAWALGVDPARVGPERARRTGCASQLAHIYALHFTKTCDHRGCFVKRYETIERIMLGFGFGPILLEVRRFGGCPPDSAAARLEGTQRPQVSRAEAIVQEGVP